MSPFGASVGFGGIIGHHPITFELMVIGTQVRDKVIK